MRHPVRKRNINIEHRKMIQENHIHRRRKVSRWYEQLSKNDLERINVSATCKRPVTQNPITCFSNPRRRVQLTGVPLLPSLRVSTRNMLPSSISIDKPRRPSKWKSYGNFALYRCAKLFNYSRFQLANNQSASWDSRSYCTLYLWSLFKNQIFTIHKI